MKHAYRLLAAAVLSAGIAAAGTIISADASSHLGWYSPSNTGAAVFSWTQTGTYTGVTIQADLATDVAIGYTPQLATVNVFLTDKIGSGTTSITNQIAFATGVTVPTYFNASASGFSLVTLFSGLTLGPGTYYVTVNPTSAIYPISFAEGIANIVTDTGVAYGISDYSNSNTAGTFSPAWTFTPEAAGTNFDINVTGTSTSATPEPTTLLLSGSAMGALFFFRRRPSFR